MRFKLQSLWGSAKLMVAAAFWYCLGMRVRAKNRLYMALHPFVPVVNRNLKRAPGICAAQDHVSKEDRARMEEAIASWQEPPLIAIVMPVYNTDEAHLKAALKSVREQVYPHWQLCIADDASTAPHIRPLLERAEREDSRIKVIFRQENGHISHATNSALQCVEGPFVALMDHDDTLPAHALYHVAREIIRHPDVDLIYSDEDKIREDGTLAGPHFKPDWNEELFLTQNYINHLTVIRRSLLEKVGGLRPGFEGSQDHDLVLRIVRETQPERIRHIPRILYHWRAFDGSNSFSDRALNKAVEARQRAARDYLVSRHPDLGISVTEGPFGCNKISYSLPHPAPKVSIIIPTRDQLEHLRKCITSLFSKTDYPDYEVIILDNDSAEDETKRYFAEISDRFGVRVLPYPGEFNYSALNNFGVGHAHGDVIALLNNDVEVINGRWLSELVSYAIRPDIGAAGARLLYDDETIQHAGVIIGVSGVADHAFRFYPTQHSGYNARLQLPQYISAVTGACLVVEKSKFLAVGGLDEESFKVAYNDVDFCLKLSAQGLHNVYVPYAELYHHESVSRGRDNTPEKMARLKRETAALKEKWGELLERDPYYNENFLSQNAFFEFKPPAENGGSDRAMTPIRLPDGLMSLIPTYGKPQKLRKKVAFMHIAKTAGSAINQYFLDHLGEERCVCHLEGRNHLLHKEELPNLQSYDFVSGHLRYFHFTTRFDLEDWCLFTCLREPIPHVISHLLWLKFIGMDDNKTFRETHHESMQALSLDLNQTSLNDVDTLDKIIYEKHPHALPIFENCQTRYFLRDTPKPLTLEDREMALQNTKHFRYICLSEQLEPHLAYLSKQLHLRPRVKLKRVNLSRLKEAPDFSIPEVKDFYYRLVGHDLHFYEAIKQTRTSTERRQPPLLEPQPDQERPS